MKEYINRSQPPFPLAVELQQQGPQTLVVVVQQVYPLVIVCHEEGNFGISS